MKLTVALIFATFAIGLAASANKVCYFTSWTVYRPGNGKFNVSNIDPTLCTHIIYGFLGLSWDYKVQILDDWELDGLEELQHLLALRDKNPGLKVLASMGGWNEGSGKYSDMASDPQKRSTLVADVVSWMKQHGFDGFDLDWEYPGQRDGSRPDTDPANFVLLLQELRNALHAENMILSIAVGGAKASIDASYIVPEVSEAVDLLNVMSYDFHGAFEPFVGHCAPLYASSLDVTDEQKEINVAAGINHWIEKGVDISKVNLGLATYGRSFTLADPSNTALYAPITGGGAAGPYTRQDGILGYNEICELHSDWEYIWDEEQVVPHRVSGNQWVGYDDARSIVEKVKFAKSKNLGGIMFWSFDTDDFRGLCGGGTYPLMRAAANELDS
ncbi:chitotriosidase-1-like [Aethina tumida]|uniref:chitotriosidase-1-like n=1 Tax=Aethina tumida TaxID=116153 RepID=UPI00214842B3|nr:chitotriosidase-1-like [Aethina tumida]